MELSRKNLGLLNPRLPLRAYRDVFIGCFKLGLMEGWAFRSFSVNMLLSYPIIIFANYYLFGSLYAPGSERVAGFTKAEILLYISIAWLLRSVFPSRSGRLMAQRIRSGELATDLMKPLPLLMSQLARNLGFATVALATVSVPLLVLTAVSGAAALPPRATSLPAFFISAFMGFLILFACNFIMSILSFYMEYSTNLMWLFDLIVQLAGGLSVPLSFFPDRLQSVLGALPFKDIYATPTQIYLGQYTPGEIPVILGEQLMWLVVVLLAGMFLFRSGLNHLSINGG